MRLNAYLARAGYGGRREATRLIAAGRVQVNGQVTTNPGEEIIPDKSHVRVDGKLIKRLWPLSYLVLNKPAGAITATVDPQGRPTVYDWLGRYRQAVQSVGRLDYDTEGVLLFTNDGDLAHALTSPQSKVQKTYKAKIKGHLDPAQLNRLRQGVEIGGYVTAPAKVQALSRLEANTWLRITLTEGKYRQIKRMVEAVGHAVLRLTRESFGPVELGDLRPGQFRFLDDWEIRKLREATKT